MLLWLILNMAALIISFIFPFFGGKYVEIMAALPMVFVSLISLIYYYYQYQDENSNKDSDTDSEGGYFILAMFSIVGISELIFTSMLPQISTGMLLAMVAGGVVYIKNIGQLVISHINKV